ncbi:MAG: DUF5674 family protein [Gemmatimonadaceae bacterium]
MAPLTSGILCTRSRRTCALFGDMVKAVVDVRRNLMAIGGEVHSDEESVLLDDGSEQSNLWGINLMTLHAALASGGWSEMTLAEQLANVGSEVDRAIRASRSGRAARFENALDRALELFDLTAADDRWRGPRRREVLRAREEFCRLFFDADVHPDSASGLSRYFLQFATLARASRD